MKFLDLTLEDRVEDEGEQNDIVRERTEEALIIEIDEALENSHWTSTGGTIMDMEREERVLSSPLSSDYNEDDNERQTPRA